MTRVSAFFRVGLWFRLINFRKLRDAHYYSETLQFCVVITVTQRSRFYKILKSHFLHITNTFSYDENVKICPEEARHGPLAYSLWLNTIIKVIIISDVQISFRRLTKVGATSKFWLKFIYINQYISIQYILLCVKISSFEPNRRHLRELLIYFFYLKKSAAEKFLHFIYNTCFTLL